MVSENYLAAFSASTRAAKREQLEQSSQPAPQPSQTISSSANYQPVVAYYKPDGTPVYRALTEQERQAIAIGGATASRQIYGSTSSGATTSTSSKPSLTRQPAIQYSPELQKRVDYLQRTGELNLSTGYARSVNSQPLQFYASQGFSSLVRQREVSGELQTARFSQAVDVAAQKGLITPSYASPYFAEVSTVKGFSPYIVPVAYKAPLGIINKASGQEVLSRQLHQFGFNPQPNIVSEGVTLASKKVASIDLLKGIKGETIGEKIYVLANPPELKGKSNVVGTAIATTIMDVEKRPISSAATFIVSAGVGGLLAKGLTTSGATSTSALISKPVIRTASKTALYVGGGLFAYEGIKATAQGKKELGVFIGKSVIPIAGFSTGAKAYYNLREAKFNERILPKEVVDIYKPKAVTDLPRLTITRENGNIILDEIKYQRTLTGDVISVDKLKLLNEPVNLKVSQGEIAANIIQRNIVNKPDIFDIAVAQKLAAQPPTQSKLIPDTLIVVKEGRLAEIPSTKEALSSLGELGKDVIPIKTISGYQSQFDIANALGRLDAQRAILPKENQKLLGEFMKRTRGKPLTKSTEAKQNLNFLTIRGKKAQLLYEPSVELFKPETKNNVSDIGKPKPDTIKESIKEFDIARKTIYEPKIGFIPKINTSSLSSNQQRINIKSISQPSYKVIPKNIFETKPTPSIKQKPIFEPATIITPESKPRQIITPKFDITQITDTPFKTPDIPNFTTPDIPTTKTPPAEPPPDILFGLPKGRKGFDGFNLPKPSRGTSTKGQYSVSLIANVLNIKGKKPSRKEYESGLYIRPIVR